MPFATKRPRTTNSDSPSLSEASRTMAVITDKGGKKYGLDPKHTEGNFTIVSNDGAAFRIDDFYLKASSPVFRSMLLTCHDEQDATLHLDHPASMLKVYLAALKGVEIDVLTCRTNGAACFLFGLLDVCARYETQMAARAILQCVNLDYTLPERLFPLFAAASQLRDVEFACRVLQHGYLVEVAKHRRLLISLHPNSPYGRMQAKDVDKIPSRWIWALYQAFDTTTDEVLTSKPYWVELSGRFMAALEQCKRLHMSIGAWS